MKNLTLFRISCIFLFSSLVLTACSVNGRSSQAQLQEILAQRSDEDRQRDVHRHPAETLDFFGIEPGMTVVEVLPGGGWYTRIVAPYLGESGTLHAVNYADEMWALFGFFPAEFIQQRKQQMVDWPITVASLGGNSTSARGFAFGRVPAELEGTVDAVLVIRALHNLNRFEAQAATRTEALADIYRLLKPGGVVGVVQHRAPESASDTWANGSNGYLKTSAIIDMFQEQGFVLAGRSEINANNKDRPTESDSVWRLPPSLRGADDAEKRAALNAIGESDRVTLRFEKPQSKKQR